MILSAECMLMLQCHLRGKVLALIKPIPSSSRYEITVNVPGLGGVLLELIKSARTERIRTHQTRLPALALVVVGELSKNNNKIIIFTFRIQLHKVRSMRQSQSRSSTFFKIITIYDDMTVMKTKITNTRTLVQVVVLPDPCRPTNMITLDRPFFGANGVMPGSTNLSNS